MYTYTRQGYQFVDWDDDEEAEINTDCEEGNHEICIGCDCGCHSVEGRAEPPDDMGDEDYPF